MNEKKLLKEIRTLYLNLNKIVIPLYNFKNCPKCGGNVMSILRISDTGKSIDCSCESCGEIITSTIISGKDPSQAIYIQNVIKGHLQMLYDLIGEEVHKRDIDIAFTINS
jgi:transcription elongation factor Elf1